MLTSGIFVVHWRHHDGRASGIAACYSDRAEAERLFDILNELCDGNKEIMIWASGAATKTVFGNTKWPPIPGAQSDKGRDQCPMNP